MQAFSRDLENTNRELAAAEVIPVTLNVMKHLSPDHLSIAVSLLARMILNTDSDK